MIAEELFLFTMEDLDDRLGLERGEYDGVCLAGLLRKLLLDGRRSLLEMVAREAIHVRFVVRDWPVPAGMKGSRAIEPEDGEPTLELSTREFLKLPVVGAWDRQPGAPDPFKSLMVSIEDLIAFLANNEGGVHISVPTKRHERALWDLCWGERRFGPEGMLSGGVYALISVARVTQTALQPLRAALTQEFWPAHLPVKARGSRRVRDPQHYGRRAS